MSAVLLLSILKQKREIAFLGQKVPLVDEEESVDFTDASISFVWIFLRKYASFGPHPIELNRRMPGIKGQRDEMKDIFLVNTKYLPYPFMVVILRN